MQEYGSQGDTCDNTADDHRHEILSFTHELEWQAIILLWDDVLRKSQHEVKRKNGKDSLHKELIPQYLQGHYQ